MRLALGHTTVNVFNNNLEKEGNITLAKAHSQHADQKGWLNMAEGTLIPRALWKIW